MSMCCSVSPTTEPFQWPLSCIQHPLTKAALFVIAFLLTGCATLSYFVGLGTAAVTSFSLASVATFVAACVVTARCPAPPSLEELIHSLPSCDFLHTLPKNIDAKTDEVEDAYAAALSPYIKAIFGKTIDVRAIQSLIDYAAYDPKKLFYIVGMIIDESKGNFNDIASVLEKLNWPDEKIKKEILIKALGIHMAECLVDAEEEDTSDILVNVMKIFGEGDFCSDPERISPFVSEALGYSIKKMCKIGEQMLASEKEQGDVDKDCRIDLQFYFVQSKKCRFPASVITPALPYLKNLPALTALFLSDIGTKEGCGFQDEDVDLLLEVLKTNPRLVKFKVNTKSMSSEIREAFNEEKKNILASRKLALRRAALPSTEELEGLVHSLPSSEILSLKGEDAQMTEKEKKAYAALKLYIQELFEEDDVDFAALQSLIDYAAHDPDKLLSMVWMIINKSELFLSYVTSLLEKLNWPDEVMKNEILLNALTIEIKDSLLIEEEKGATSIHIDVQEVFGRGDFCDHPEQISPLVSQALGRSIRMFFEASKPTSESEEEKENQDKDVSTNMQLYVKQSKKCHFPASAITPALPYLKNLPGLTVLYLSDIGTKEEHGFQDKDADLLLEVLKTNSRLVKFKVKTESMSSEKREAFEREKQQILDSR